MATLAFNVETDYEKVIKLRDEIKRLNEALADVSQNRTPEEIAKLEEQLASAQSEMNKAVTAAAKLGNELDKSFGGGKALSVLDDMKESIKLQIDYLGQLKRKYQEVYTSLQSAPSGSNKNIQLQTELRAIKTEIDEEEAALKQLEQEYNNLATVSTPSFRTQIRELTNQLAQMRMEGQQNTEEYKRMEQELAKLLTVQRQIQQTRRADSTGATQITAWMQGVQGLMGAYTAASGAVGLFIKDQEKLAAVQTKMQSLMAILIGLQQASNVLHSTSLFRLRALTAVQDWWNKLLAIGRGEQIANNAATAAATVAQTAQTTSAVAGTAANIGLAGAFRMVGAAIKSIPVFGWIVAGISALIAVISSFSSKASEAKKKTKEFYKAVADEASKPIAKIEELSGKWSQLGDVMAKKKFIEDNKQAFDSLGVAINSVVDAENLLMSNKQAFIDAQIEKAKASVRLAEAQELVKEIVELEEEIESMPDMVTRINYYDEFFSTEVVEKNEAKIKKRQELAEKTEKLNAKIDKANEYNTKAQKKLDEAEIKTEKKYTENSINDLNNQISNLEKELKDLDIKSDEYRKKQEEINKLREKINAATSSSSTSTSTTEKDNTQQVLDKQEKERIRQEQDTEFAIRQAQIDVMKESNEKVIEQYRLDFEKQKVQIDRWYEDLKDEKIKKAKELWDANPNNKGKQFDESTVDLTYTEQETTLYNAKMVTNENKYQKQMQNVYAAEKKSMWAFLKEYGTYEQQRLAITEEYAGKMADASNIYEKMQLEAEKNSKLQALAFQFKDDTNWETIFTNIDNYTVDYLQEIQQKLKELLGSEDITADQAEAMGKQLERVNQLILQKSESWADVMGLASQRQRELNMLMQAQVDATDRLQEAQERYNNSLANTQSLQEEIGQLLQGLGIDTDGLDINVDNQESILSSAKENGASNEEIKAIQELIVKLGASQAQDVRLAASVEKNTEKLKAATQAYEGASKKSKEEKKNDTIDTAQKIADELKSAGASADMLGMDESIGATFGALSDGVNSSINAFKDFSEGNYVGAALDVFSAVGSFGEALGIWGDSDKTLMMDIERMTAENEDLERAISELTDVMSQYTTSLADAADIYQQTIDNVNQEMENTAEMMQRSAAAYKSGIGGSRSSNYRIDKNMSASDWKRVSEAAGTSVTSAEEFFGLTSEQMYQVSVQATDLYSKIKQYADDGYRDVAQYMDDYIMYWQELEELTDTFNEKLTSTTFDSVVDSFKSAIMDMEHSTADFAQDFEDMMKEAMIDSLISSTYASRLQKWYEDFATAMESGSTLDAKEQESLRNDYMDIVSDAKRDIEALYDTMGWSTSSTQSASSKGFETMSQDTADELSGRFTALQEAGYQILEQAQLGNEGLSIMTSRIDLSNVQLGDIANIHQETQSILANSYLELQQIQDNTAETVTQLLTLVKYIKTVKENTDKL